MSIKPLSKRTPSRHVECNEALDFLPLLKFPGQDCEKDISVRRYTHACSSCRPSVIYCVVCDSFVHLSRRCYVRILEARALLKIFFAVTHAAFISKISFVCPSLCLRAAGERLDTNGSVIISFSRLWNHFRRTQPGDVVESSPSAGAWDQPFHRPATGAYLPA